MFAVLAFALAVIMFVANATHGHLVADNPVDWGLVFLAAGLLIQATPWDRSFPKRGQA